MLSRIELEIGNSTLPIEPVKLYFRDHLVTNIFANKNNKTVAETLAHHRYKQFSPVILKSYSDSLGNKLGDFLYTLKRKGDNFYLKFLNRYGDDTYCTFEIQDAAYLTKKGLYLYTVNGQVKYIGRCRDTFHKRVNQGYGIIHPKNCYLDGQATNCHLNSLIAANQSKVEFYVYPVLDNSTIERLEILLIQKYNPNWNIALKRDQVL